MVAALPPPIAEFKFKVLGYDPILFADQIIPHFYIRLNYFGKTCHFYHQYQDFLILDKGLKETYGPKFEIQDLPKQTGLFLEVSPKLLSSQLEEYLNSIVSLPEISSSKYFEEFTRMNLDLGLISSSFAVYAVNVRTSEGEIGYLKAVDGTTQLSPSTAVAIIPIEEFDKNSDCLWTLHPIQVQQSNSDEIFSYYGLRSVAFEGFLYRSRLYSNIKLHPFSYRSWIDMKSTQWAICKETEDPLYFYANEKFLSVSSKSSNLPLHFRLDKIFNATWEINDENYR